MAEMSRTFADIEARRHLHEQGVILITEAALLEWHDDRARCRFQESDVMLKLP